MLLGATIAMWICQFCGIDTNDTPLYMILAIYFYMQIFVIIAMCCCPNGLPDAESDSDYTNDLERGRV